MRGDLKIMENKELKAKFIDEKTGIEYTLQGDYYMPNIIIPKARMAIEGDYIVIEVA